MSKELDENNNWLCTIDGTILVKREGLYQCPFCGTRYAYNDINYKRELGIKNNTNNKQNEALVFDVDIEYVPMVPFNNINGQRKRAIRYITYNNSLLDKN